MSNINIDTNNTDADTTVEEIPKPRKPRGFAALTPERRREISSAGGRSAHRLGVAHQWNGVEAAIAGRKGGMAPKKKSAPVIISEEIAPPSKVA